MASYDPNHDAYAILGVAPDATPKAIGKAYRKSALIWHPDKSPAPDAAERFHEVKQAAHVLRNPMLRKLYDIERARWRGKRGQSTREPRQRKRPVYRTPEPHERMQPPPDWLAPAVRLHYDSVHIQLEVARTGSRAGSMLYASAAAAAFGSLVRGDFRLFGLALVLYSAGRLVRTAPNEGVMKWVKLTPGQRIAELHMLDQRASNYERFTIPYPSLGIVIAESGPTAFQIQIDGFPRACTPILFRSNSQAEAKRLAKEASSYFEIPITE